MFRTYSELSKLQTFGERYNYLKLGGIVGEETFGFDRYLNQALYRSYEWERIRNQVILRDNGCDLGLEGYDILIPNVNYRRKPTIIIHHMNPIGIKDIINRNPDIFNPEYLITVSLKTHNAIHYGDESLLPIEFNERTKNDTCPWR